MSVILLAGILIVLASLAQYFFSTCKEGFQDSSGAESMDSVGSVSSVSSVPTETPVVASAPTDEVRMYKDLMMSIDDAITQVSSAGGADMVKKRLDKDDADAFDTALSSLNSLQNLFPSTTNPEEITATLRKNKVDLVTFEPLIRDQVKTIQKALVTPVKEVEVEEPKMPEVKILTPPSTGQGALVAMSEEAPIEPTAPAVGMEGFASYQNPYNQNSAQAYQFTLGKQALINSVRSPLLN